jgi:soluble lytic murein transglycosylase-like protein
MAHIGFRGTIAGVVCALALGHAPQAFAQVLELQADGSIVRRETPMVRLTIGARPIHGEIKYADQVFFAPSEIAAAIRQASKRYAVPASIVEAVAWQESRFNQRAVSPRGARGVMQLMPGTARGLGVDDPFDPAQAIDGGARLLRSLLDRFGRTDLALAAYNAGPGAVSRYGGIPPYPETQRYVRNVMAMAGTA